MQFNHFRTRSIFYWCLPLLVSAISTSATFNIHCRDRSPELIPTQLGCIGPVAEIVEIALMRNKHKINWTTENWDNTIILAETGGVDMVIRHSMNKERDVFLDEVAYGYQVRKVDYYISPKVSKSITAKADLNGLKIGALGGSFYSKDFEENTEISKVFYKSTSELVTALTEGIVDVVVTSSAHDLDRFKIILGARAADYFETFYNGRYLSIPKSSKRSKYFTKFEETIQKMVKDGEVDRIFNKYSLEPPTQLDDDQ
jgi:polar amino acid transport system substrate-binding protein